MKSFLGIFNTDLVNKYKQRIPLRELASSFIDSPSGLPQCLGHDMHRPAGWAKLLGLHFEKNICSLIGVSNAYENDDEAKLICQKHKIALQKYVDEMTRDSRKPFLESLKNLGADSPKITYAECCIALEENIAVKAFPKLFEKCDKDGLISISDILTDFTYNGDGIFCSKNSDYAVLAHQFFRKRLSIHNSCCNLFLNELIQSNNHDWNAKIRIDKNMLGWKHGVKRSIELEYWYGPKFNGDVSKIQKGVARHKSSEDEALYSLIDSTDFSWYYDNQSHTFECEEITTQPSVGVSDEHYGFRYIHSIYEHGKQAIVHFDAAIKLYNEEEYVKRLDQSLDKVDKNIPYTKLFRIDGQLAVSDWKRLCVLFMQGNPLISEYFGVKQFPEKNDEVKKVAYGERLSNSLYKNEYGVRAFLSCVDGTIESDSIAEFDVLNDGENQYSVVDSDVIEFVKESKKNGLDLHIPESVMRMDINDSYINIPTIKISSNENFEKKVHLAIQSLSSTLKLYNEHYSQKNIAFTLAWPFLERIAKLSFIGGIQDVIDCIAEINRLPKTKEEFLDFVEELQKNINLHIATENTFDKLSPIGLNGNMRLHRRPIQPSSCKINHEDGIPFIELSKDVSEIVQGYKICPVIAFNAKSSSCSICGKEYWDCEHQKFVDENCYEKIKDVNIIGCFWSVE